MIKIKIYIYKIKYEKDLKQLRENLTKLTRENENLSKKLVKSQNHV
jgi:hypothetical protein